MGGEMGWDQATCFEITVSLWIILELSHELLTVALNVLQVKIW